MRSFPPDLVRAEAEAQGILPARIALAAREGTACEERFGFRDSARWDPAREKTVYRVDSILELFTAILVFELAEDGGRIVAVKVGPVEFPRR